MQPKTFPFAGMSIHSAGWAAIASGVIGLLAYGCLVSYLMMRNQGYEAAIFLVRLHDMGVILQFLFLIPVVFALHKLSHRQSSRMSRTTLTIGIVAALFTALFLLLGIVKVIEDALYMFPQGVFGVWLMVVCWVMPSIFSKGLRWLGIIVGLGLALVGTFPLGYAIFVDSSILRIPPTMLSDEELRRLSRIPANLVLHQIIWIGTYMGVATLPIWTIWLGWRLLKNASPMPDTPAPILA